MREEDKEVLVKFRNLAMEAADALWALEEGRPVRRPPKVINADIHNLRPKVDALLGIQR